MSLSVLLQQLYKNARASGDAVALFYQKKSITYAVLLEELEKYAKKIAHAMADKPNDTPVCLLGNDKLMLVVLQLAVLRAGRFFTVLDHLSLKAVIESQVQQLGSELVILGNSNEADDTEWKRANFPHRDQIISASELSAMSDGELPEDMQDTALAYVLLTSGSTGEPKAVMQTHVGLFQQIQRYYRIIEITDNNQNRIEHFSNFAPLCHDQGIVDIYAAMLLQEAKLSMFDIQTLFSTHDGIQNARLFLSEQQISIFSGLPEVFQFIFSGQSENSFPSLRVIAIGAEAVKKEHMEIFLRSCPTDSCVYNSYGASECSWICGHKITKNEAQILLRDNSSIPIGYPDQTLTVLINLLEDDDNDQAQVDVGELCIAGDGVSPGYFRNEAATNQAFFRENQWFYRTGDIVELRDSVLLHKGRLARLEKIAGKRVDINDLEKTLCALLGVHECPVVVVQFGEQKILCAFVASPDHKAALSWQLAMANPVIQKNLAPHLRPYALFKLKELPKLASGKLDHRALRKMAHDTLNTLYDFQGSPIEQSVFLGIFKTIGRMSQDLEAAPFKNFMTSVEFSKFRNVVNQMLGKEMVQFYHWEITPNNLALVIQEKLGDQINLDNIILRYIHNIVEFTHAMIKRVMRHFMERFPGLRLIACISYLDFRYRINEQLQNKIPRVGYTIPINDNPRYFSVDYRECHPIACVVEYHEDNIYGKSLTLWFSDSRGAYSLYSNEIRIQLKEDVKAKKYSVPITVHEDYLPRQKESDLYNCVFDALSFLLNAFYEPNLSDWLIALPHQHTDHLDNICFIRHFQLPRRMIHSIPVLVGAALGTTDEAQGSASAEHGVAGGGASAGGGAAAGGVVQPQIITRYLHHEKADTPEKPKYALPDLAQFYTKLIEALVAQDRDGTPVPDLASLMPHGAFFSSDINDNLITSYDFREKLKPLNEQAREAIYHSLLANDQLLNMIENAVDLGNVMKYLTLEQCLEVCEKIQIRISKILLCPYDVGVVLSYLDEEKKRQAVSQVLGELFLSPKFFKDVPEFNVMLRYMNMLNYVDDAQFLEKLKFFCGYFRDLSNSASRQKSIEAIVYVMQYSENSGSRENQRTDALENLLLEIIGINPADIAYTLRLLRDDKEYFDAHSKLYTMITDKISAAIESAADFLEVVSHFPWHGGDWRIWFKMLDHLLTLETLNKLGWNDPIVKTLPKLVREEIEKTKSVRAVEAFFEACPGWNRETASEAKGLNKIIRFAHDAPQVPNQSLGAPTNIATQARDALIKCGVNPQIFTSNASLEEKKKQAMDEIIAHLVKSRSRPKTSENNVTAAGGAGGGAAATDNRDSSPGFFQSGWSGNTDAAPQQQSGTDVDDKDIPRGT